MLGRVKSFREPSVEVGLEDRVEGSEFGVYGMFKFQREACQRAEHLWFRLCRVCVCIWGLG